MKSEIRIILEEGKSNKVKGNCFENLMYRLLSLHQYKVRGNINYGGMEIDLIADHKHKNELLYVECKAKQKVTSDELSKFCFNADMNDANAGYFFRTQDLESQAGSLLTQIRQKEKYKNLTFFEPDDIIQMLLDGKLIFEKTSVVTQYSVSKRFCAITYLGDFFIYLINDSNLYPSEYIIINAIDNSLIVPNDVKSLLHERIDEISELTLINVKENAGINKIENTFSQISFETISEVQESENWYDPLPASYTYKNFVGRDLIRSQIFDFFKDIQEKKTNKRIFYLNGKSGWGKSSLIAEIRGRCRNKFYRNKYFALAIDTRSANSNNFVALAFEKLIQKATDAKFLNKSVYTENLNFTSHIDLLSSESVKGIMYELEKKDRHLILIFDQFEDIFRKKELFKSFYKFLSDITDLKPNIIVGFSWKSEIVIPIENEAYSFWQQAQQQAREFYINEFGEKEIDALIKQLEKTCGRLDRPIKNRIKESSRGLPWLTKKLCIHIYEQINAGIRKDKLIEDNLNIISLFNSDIEKVTPKEAKALKLIAKKAQDGSFFDVEDIGESIDGKVIESLLHRRLIIKSGSYYNIYWDIFRDYLINKEVPIIGESYLIRQGVNLCLEVFLLFKNKSKSYAVQDLLNSHPKNIGKSTLENILIELINLGVIIKISEFYKISNPNISITEDGLKSFITKRFENYTPYKLLQIDKSHAITKESIVKVLKATFKNEYKDKTWETYSKILLGWFSFSKLDIKSRLVELRKGRSIDATFSSDKSNLLPRSSFKDIIGAIRDLKSGTNVHPALYRDLLLFGIVDSSKNVTNKFQKIKDLSNSELKIELLKTIDHLPKMIKINKYLKQNGKVTAVKLLNGLGEDFFDGEKYSTKKQYASKALTWCN